ncbi:MAG: DUF1572 domain-containing protein [Bryobacteraceae bacterium]|nr:DUF1572 domain-containing protein [Bryobacteraceae bacterium]
MESTGRLFLAYSRHKLRQSESRIATCLTVLSDAQLWARPNPASNSVGNLVLHLAGNLRQWVIAGVGQVPDIRQRDAEFAARASFDGNELALLLESTLIEADAVLAAVPETRLTERVEIQGFRLTVLDAIYHAVEHFSGHTYQIILLAKAQRGEPFDFYAYLGSPHENEIP